MEQYTNKTCIWTIKYHTKKMDERISMGIFYIYIILRNANFMIIFLCLVIKLIHHNDEKHPNQATPLLTTTNSAISTNGNSDFESGDETHIIIH